MTIKLIIAEAYDLGDGRRQLIVEVNDYPRGAEAVPYGQVPREDRSTVRQLARTPFEFDSDTDDEEATRIIRAAMKSYLDEAKDTPEARAKRPTLDQHVGKVL
jgi:hypothetical protein